MSNPIVLHLKTSLLEDRSRQNIMAVAKWIGDDPKKFGALIQLVQDNDIQISSRAAWVMSYCVEDYPQLLDRHLEALIPLLSKPVHDGVKRNIVRVLQFHKIPEKYQGTVVVYCFDLLSDSKAPIAVQAFSMTVLYNISKQQPGLKNELKMAIENLLPDGSAGIRNRGMKILTALEKP